MAKSRITEVTGEFMARGRARRVALDECVDIRLKFGPDSWESRGGAKAEEVVFILVYCVTEFTTTEELCLTGGQASGLSAVRIDPHLIP